jgi:hypothetical protein
MQLAKSVGGYSYQRHRPEETVLYKIIQEDLETFLRLVHEECGRPLPGFVEKEFREYLKCGILAHGFLRAKCESCSHEHLVAFSCKRRGFCPSCGGRRMAESAIHLVDEVLPVKPIRQWVMSFPIQIRLLLAIKPKIMTEVLNIVTHTISRHLCKKAGLKHQEAKTGTVTLIQRFGGSINLNIHFHQLYLDGVFELDDEKKPSTFHNTKAPSASELTEVLNKIIHRTVKHLERRGLVYRDEEDGFQLNLSEDDALARLQAGAVTYRFTLGPNKGKKALTLKTLPDTDHTSHQGLVAKQAGFSLHAGVAMAGGERDKIEKLCRYIARPAVALDRLSLSASGQVIYTLKKPYDDGTTAISMTRLELLERLAALVPRPRIHLTRFSGVFAPHYKYRAMVVLKAKKSERAVTDLDQAPAPRSSRISWARLLKRVFNIDINTCSVCQGQMKIIAAIEDPQVIKKILSHLGLPTKAPAIYPARGPPVASDDHQQLPEYELM